jgi:hypothetical protein
VNFLRRLLNSDDERGTPAPEAFTIRFPGDQSRPAVYAPRSASPQAVIAALELEAPTPTIFISGGAAMMEGEVVKRLRSSIEDGLVRFLSTRNISLIDGGTATGVMPLIGVARQRRGYRFPLIGVAPAGKVSIPEAESAGNAVPLDAAHSHFVLVEGEQFGAESEMIIQLAYALSGAGNEKRLQIVVNGGEIVRREAHRCSTRAPRFPLLVLEGSGRFADELAQARERGSGDPLIREILDQGIVHFIPVSGGTDNLYRWLENFFGE